MKELIQELMPQILSGVAIPVLAIIGTYLGKFLKQNLENIRNDAIRSTAFTLVQWASQKLTGGGRGKEKFDIVSRKLVDRFPWADEEVIEEAIEAGVKNLGIALGNKVSFSVN